MNRQHLFRGLGLVVWLLALAGVASAMFVADRTSESAGAVSLLQYLAGPAERPRALDPTRQLRVSDPVFRQAPDGSWIQIGFVAKLLETEQNARTVELSWFDRELSASECVLTQHHNSGRLEDVVRLLFPAEKRSRIQRRLAEAFELHGDEIAAAVGPLVEQSLRDSLPLIEAELRESIEEHREDVDAVAARLKRDLVQQRLIPLAKQRLVPIVRRHAQEPADSIGRELWDRASVWRFGWRAIYDSSPLPQRDLARREWRRFVSQEVTEVLEQHADELTVAVQRIVADIAADPAIRRELAESAQAVTSDPETRRLVQTLLEEAIVENQALRERWREIWTSEQAAAALSVAGERLEPIVRSIGDDIFGTRAGGIDPDFARVLRNQVLGKDRRWIVARPVDRPTDSIIRVATSPMAYPVVYLAQQPPGASE